MREVPITKLYAGLDVSLETTSVCVVGTGGRVRLEAKVCTEFEALVSILTELDEPYERVGLEAGPLSPWLYFGPRDAGPAAICVETRHMKAEIVVMTQKIYGRHRLQEDEIGCDQAATELHYQLVYKGKSRNPLPASHHPPGQWVPTDTGEWPAPKDGSSFSVSG